MIFKLIQEKNIKVFTDFTCKIKAEHKFRVAVSEKSKCRPMDLHKNGKLVLTPPFFPLSEHLYSYIGFCKKLLEETTSSLSVSLAQVR